LVGAYLDAAFKTVTEMGGKVIKKLDDRLMARFGYPVAQENDAERAVRAARSSATCRTSRRGRRRVPSL
jgi:class 3 adenylate cyclase